jgi:hypothetical protein
VQVKNGSTIAMEWTGGTMATKKATTKKSSSKSSSTKSSTKKGGSKKSTAKKSAAKKSGSRKAASKTSKRTLIEPTPGDKRYVRRNKKGEFKKVVNVGRSLAADRRSKSTTKAKPGQGDKGDR